MVKNQFNTTIKEWMSDAGGEYKFDEFICTLKDSGIKILQSIPHTPQQNGCTECFMRTCMDKAQALHLDACFPESWWEFAVEHAIHCYNRTPIRCLKWRTPYEALNGTAPDISHLQVFGCAAYVYIPADTCQNKFAPKSELMAYLGATEGIKGHRFMHLTNNQIYTAAMALFNESLFPKCTKSRTPSTTRVRVSIDD